MQGISEIKTQEAITEYLSSYFASHLFSLRIRHDKTKESNYM